MSVIVSKEIAAARTRTAEQVHKRLERQYERALGKEAGRALLNTTIDILSANSASDSSVNDEIYKVSKKESK